MVKQLFATLLLLGCVPAWSIPVQWMLDDVVFDDGVTASGSFIYDAELGLAGFSDIAITTTSTTATIDYTFLNAYFVGLAADSVAFLSGPDNVDFNDALIFNLDAELTNAGGVIGIVSPSGEMYCYDNGFTGDPCGQPFFPDARLVVSGSLNGTVVPIPATVWLLGTALAGLCFGRRRIEPA